MVKIRAETKQFDVAGVVFDKDGTLIDFEKAWGRRIREWVKHLVSAAGGGEALSQSLFHMFGYEPVRRQVMVDGPILAASGSTMKALTAGVLYAEQGLPWHEAENFAAESMQQFFSNPLTDDEIRPLGDVQGTVRRLCDAGIKIAVATADGRTITEHCLDVLEIRQEIDLLMCGDDALPQKPDPGVLAWIGDALGIAPDKFLMVGDSINDMLTGRNGNAAGCVGIYPHGGQGSAVLAPFADVVLDSIGELRVECP